MVDVNMDTVCCMCGDVGFPEQLFRCARCLSRFQHAYCSNYYEEDSREGAGFCDWCRSEERSTSRQQATAAHPKKSPSRKDPAQVSAGNPRADHSPVGEKGKPHSSATNRPEDAGGSVRGKSGSGAEPSSRPPAGRRYKLLKDVLR